MKKLIDWTIVCLVVIVSACVLVPTVAVLIVSSVIRVIAFRVFNIALDTILSATTKVN